MTEWGDKDRSGVSDSWGGGGGGAKTDQGSVTVGGQIQIRGTVTELGAKDRSGEQ